MSSNSISSDSIELEFALRDLAPHSLDEAFLSRLESAADGSLLALTASEMQFETSLRQHAPIALSAEYLNRLEAVVAGVEFAVDDKIVLFPKTAPVIARPAPKSRYPMWAAAAAVALIGAATALLMPPRKAQENFVRNTSDPVISAPVNSNYVAAGFKSGIDDAVDEGVTWQQGNQPHRVLKFKYVDKLTLKTPEGKTVEVEQPQIEYILVPEKMD